MNHSLCVYWYELFNKTLRLSLPTVCEAASLLKEAHCSRVRDAGFGVVFELTVKKNVSRILINESSWPLAADMGAV